MANIAAMVMLVLLLASTACGGPVHETFKEGKVPTGWQASGHWTRGDGGLRAADIQKSEASLSIGDAEWGNAVIELQFAFEVESPQAWLAITARQAEGGRPPLRLIVRSGPKNTTTLELAVPPLAPGKGWHVLHSARVSKALGRDKHRLRLEVGSDWIRGFFDGQRVLQTPRAGELAPRGRVSLHVAGVPAIISEVKVAPLAADAPQPRTNSQPLLIAHRGFSSIAPENTLAAYRKAIEIGAEMAECDVYLTRDGVPILLHDRTLKRTTGVDARPRDLTLAEIKKLDAGKWMSAEYAGEGVPTLREALDLIRGKLRLVIEIKETDIEEPILKVIRESGVAPEDLTIFSFYYEAAVKMGQLEPLLATTWLIGDLPYDDAGRQETIRQALKGRLSAIGLPVDRADPTFLRQAHKAGLSVYVWTVDEPLDMRFLIRAGADGIITNKPDVLKAVLSEAP